MSVVIMVALLTSLIYLYRYLKHFDYRDHLLKKITISVYLGWISVATVANFSAFLVSKNWQGGIIGEMNWAVLMIFLVTILTLYMIYFQRDISFAMVIVWALFGISQKQPDNKFLEPGAFAFYSYVVIIFAILIMLLFYTKKRILRI
jgi:hypothetical protein